MPSLAVRVRPILVRKPHWGAPGGAAHLTCGLLSLLGAEDGDPGGDEADGVDQRVVMATAMGHSVTEDQGVEIVAGSVENCFSAFPAGCRDEEDAVGGGGEGGDVGGVHRGLL